jgi:hypothetical protein
MASCLYLLREPVERLEASLFVPQDAAYVLLEDGLPDSSTSFAEKRAGTGSTDSSPSGSLTDEALLELVCAYSKVIVL